MTEQKQIEEMAKVIDEYTEPLSARDIHKADFSEKFAEHFYTAGYRKQIVGEWIEVEDTFLYRYKCSLCGEIKLGKMTNFCPNCGAKMKGDEGK